MSARPAKLREMPTFVDPAEFTPHFAWKKAARDAHAEHVFCEGLDLHAAAASLGTPTYLYSRAAIVDAYREFDRGLRRIPHRICFAVKSNGNLSILRELARMGSGFDIVSGGELEHLRHLGVRGDRIVFSGVGKTRYEIRDALQYSILERGRGASRASGILLFNVESEAELGVLLEESERHVRRGGKVPGVAIRVNPDVAAGGHPHISTGQHTHKFGLDWPEARRLYLRHQDSRYLRWKGISAHIGSQIVSLKPFRRAFGRVAGHVRELRRAGIRLQYVDFGGGLGVRYTTEETARREGYARMVAHLARPLGLHLLLEPGRSIVAAAGILLTRVIYTKRNRGKTFVIVDAAMNDLLRPALYGAVHPITRIARPAGDTAVPTERVDIVGPVCETGDCLLHDWPLGEVQPGDALAIWAAGAYGMAQASNYNARTRPSEVLVDGSKARLIRRRETQADLLRTDVLPPAKRMSRA
ncbi:MAG TPA: diaminopimelate decarboxylase [Candidatus Methylomirabilis sp.]|nr:diaminopimelate decarboxylase [Candidatus Methylomirabilis sp.]